MKKIEFTDKVKFGDTEITSITVSPLTFMELNTVWERVGATGKVQRERILHQVEFRSASEVIVPDHAQLGQLPIKVAKDILAALDAGNGEAGELIGKGDGVTSPILYKLGTPIAAKDGKGEALQFTELEFKATTYAEVEDILAADNEIAKALLIIEGLAVPLGGPALPRLPGWALDKLTVADGLMIIQHVSPSF